MHVKLASALLYLSQKEFTDEKVFLHLTRQDIADFATIAQESTIKLLKEFEREGFLSLMGKEIIIEREKLRDIDISG